MTKVQHTPGPWRAAFNGTFWEIQTEDDFGQIGDVCASSATAPRWGRSLELAEANARLIATAPKLLERLEAILHSLDENGIPFPGMYLSEEISKARAAISEARAA